MTNYVVTGAGSTDYNGTYVDQGLDSRSNHYYELDSSHWLANSFTGAWVLTDSFNPSTIVTGIVSYVNLTGIDTGTWTTGGGSPPAPTVSLAPSTFTVTNTNDSGTGSLRAAITSANGAPGATINFQAALSGTVSLVSALPDITAGVTIDATGASVTVDGVGTFQIVKVNVSGSAVSINKLSFVNGGGVTGGAIQNAAGNLTINNCQFNNCLGASGGALWSYDNMILENSTFIGNNGGANSGGGAVGCDGGTQTITNCTFYDNTSSTFGGAVVVFTNPITITNCTFAGNNANPGGGVSDGGGGVHAQQVGCTIINCIGWGNTPDQFVGYQTTITVTYSAVQGGYTGTGNISVDPVLALPAMNGGTTETMAITHTSSAYQAATATGAPALDQRGVTRPTPPSMGAYDFVYAPPSAANALWFGKPF